MVGIIRRIFLTVFVLFLLLLMVFTGISYAASPSNAGFLGLWEYPTAQVPGDGMGRVGISWFEPYRPYYISLGYFPWMELNLRLTRFATGGMVSEGYGKYKDKAIDLKFLMFKQDECRPSVAFGVTDILGTKIMQAYYSVATWEWDRLALTWGYGSDRLNGFFGGLSWQPYDWLEVKAEYSPLDYSQDTIGSRRIIAEDVDSKVNVGFVAKTPWGVDASLSYQRGEEWCFGFSYNFDLTKPFFGKNKKKYDVPAEEDVTIPDWDDTDLEDLAEKISEYTGDRIGVRDVEVFIGDRKVLVAYENIGYTSQAEAMARVLTLTSLLLPWDTETLFLVPRLRGEAISVLEVPGYQCGLLRLGDISATDVAGAEITWAGADLFGKKWPVHYGPGRSGHKGNSEFKAMLVYEPRIDRTLQEDYMDRWSVDWIYRMRSSQGWEAIMDIRQPIDNDIDIYWEPETNDETRIWKGVLSYLYKINDRFFALGEAGWLDAQWFGGNAWARFYSDDGRWWVGGRMSVVHERDPEGFASLADKPVTFGGTGRITVGRGYPDDEWWWEYCAQAGYHDPVYDLDLTGEYGVFIDGDWGARFSATRWWNNLGVGFWIARTDNLTMDKRYSNAGMYLEIPADYWFGRESAHTWTSEFTLLSTWNYYAARQPGAWRTPEQLLRQLNPDVLGKNLYKELERYCVDMGGKAVEDPVRVYGLYDYLSGNYRMGNTP